MRMAGAIMFALVLVASVWAQTPTEDQLRLFQNLPPDQQQAVLQGLGGQGGGAVVESANPRPSPQAGSERRGTPDASAPAVLGPDDLVIVELALPGTMPKGNVRSGTTQDPSAETAPRRLRSTTALEVEAQKRLQDIISAVQARNPYRLDRSGQLNLPGFAPILLGGLDDYQAVQRLSVEPSLLQLDVSVQRLPVNKVGAEGLKPYGHDMFDASASGFLQLADIPVPGDYVVGPGDELTVQLYGSQNRTQRLVVSREGTISFTELGPIRVGGMRLSEARAAIQGRVSRQMIGVQASVSMGDTRSIGILVLGEVRRPGALTVPGLATMTRALFMSGGITDIGSLREVQLKRQGRVVRTLDLYDVRMEGNTADDAMLQAGDVVFVPPVGQTASVDGEVKRPAIYELRGETSAAALVQMAGGLTTEADPSRSSLDRVDDQLRRVVLDIDFRPGAGGNKVLRNGDALHVSRLRPQIDSGVVLEGHVHRPGAVSWRDGLRLSDVLPSIDELKPNADTRYILIRREAAVDRRIEVLSADLVAALAQRGGMADKVLQPRDRITVFDLAPGRDRIIKPLLDELRLQSGLARPTEVVRVEGRVKVPGEYPLESGMTISDLLRAGGNLDSSAFGGKAELVRYEVDETGARQPKLIEVNLAGLLRGEPGADIPLRPFDNLLIKETPEWTEQESVTLKGEVRFPGSYAIRRGETLFEVIQRAGGFTPRAFVKGSAFTRAYLRDNEREQKERLAVRLRTDLAALALQAAAADKAGASQALASSQSLLSQLQAAEPVGRMVIDLPGLMASGKSSDKDIELRDGDVLVVPQSRQEVSVLGEVQNATSHRFSDNLKRDDYISLSGGTTRRADKGRIYIVRADGSVLAPRGGLRRGYDVAVQPGDTIVVPLDAEKMPRLPFWQAVTQIIYNLAISVAAINSF
jgi:polysaccharide biosynthesis/export protein